jgi:hypothetical protein
MGDRLKSHEYRFCEQLNVTPFAELSGAFPASSLDALDSKTYCFTTNRSRHQGRVRSCAQVEFSVIARTVLSFAATSSCAAGGSLQGTNWSSLTLAQL